MATPAGEINTAVLKYANDHKLKKVLNGECAELADEALKASGAMTVREIMGADKVDVDTDYIWGEEIVLADVRPGDIVQVRNYRVKWVVVESDGTVIKGEESEAHHTAVISEVLTRGTGVMNVLHQNSPQGKIVVQQELWFEDTDYEGEFNYVYDKVYYKKKGKVDISVWGTIKYYRPKAKPKPEK